MSFLFTETIALNSNQARWTGDLSIRQIDIIPVNAIEVEFKIRIANKT